MQTLSIDIGGTKIAAGIVSADFKVARYRKIETPKNKELFFKSISDIISEFSAVDNFERIGIGCAGLINKEGIVVKSPNLKFLEKTDLKEEINKICNDLNIYLNTDKKQESIKIGNDVQCFTLAEAACGAGKNYNIVAGLAVGTGLGGGIAINKKSFLGSQNFAGEFGHTIIDINYPERCACGNYGCLEQFVSGKAAEKYYQEISGEEKSALEIEKLSYKGDADALAALDKMTKYLGAGLANIVHILNPDAIVIGGGTGKTKTLFEPAIKYMRSHLLSEEIKIKVLPSQLEDEAVLIGAALL